jgi:GAF domain-containing protein
MTAREEVLARTFVQLADTLVDDFDIIDLLTVLANRCVELVAVDAVGILLADADGNLRVMAASSEAARLLELFQLQSDEGPCLDAFETGEMVIHTDLTAETVRWRPFAEQATNSGFGSVYAIPLRLRSVVMGALNLFRSSGTMPEEDIQLAQALADVASIAILQDQAIRESKVRAGQLQHALDSRVAIEQAKGMLAERGSVDMDEAFRRLRGYARRNNRQLTAVALAVVGGTMSVDDVAASADAPRRQV